MSGLLASSLDRIDVSLTDIDETSLLIRGTDGRGVFVADVAFGSDGRLWSVGSSAIQQIDTTTAEVLSSTWIQELSANTNALTVDTRAGSSGSVLYAMTDDVFARLLRINVAAAEVEEIGWVAQADPTGIRPEGFRMKSAGDLAFAPDGTLYGTVYDLPNDEADRLARIDPETGTITSWEPLGERHVQGLAFVGAELYGLTIQGWVVHIDPQTGQTTRIRRWPIDVGNTFRIGAG